MEKFYRSEPGLVGYAGIFAREEVMSGTGLVIFWCQRWWMLFVSGSQSSKQTEKYTINFEMMQKGGQIITVAFDGKIGHDQARDNSSKPTVCCAISLNNKGCRDALRDSEERYRTVADYATDWETWVDSEGKYQYCSPSCEQITGYPPEKFIESTGIHPLPGSSR